INNINQENNLSEKNLEVIRKSIMDLEENEIVEIRGAIVSIPEKNPIYDSCPNCFKKVILKDETGVCKKCGNISEPIPRMLWSLTLDDGTDNIRVTVINKVAEDLLGMTAIEAKQMIENELIEHYPLMSKKKELEGKEIIITGSIRYSSFSSKLELIANNISYPNPRDELSRLLIRMETYT
ncbi:MAG: hypothetical protein ACFFD2_15550, partial [Promethearchaeota archaeon]